MDLHIYPYEGVGPIRLGMTQDDIRKALGVAFKSFMKTADSEMPTDAFDELGIYVFYKKPGVCEAIELFFEPPYTVIFRGQVLFGRPYRELLDWFREMDPKVEEEDTGLTSYTLGIALYSPFAEENPDDPVESVFVFERGYYDR